MLVATFTRAKDSKIGGKVKTWMVLNGHGTPYDGGTKKAFVGHE